MNIPNAFALFSHSRQAMKNLQKITVANTVLHITKGARMIKRVRKYRRPEEKEDPFYYGVGPKQKVEQVYQSLIARGFGRELPPYKPPSDLEVQMHDLCRKVFGSQLNSDWKSQPLNDRVLKFKLLTKASEMFGKNIPNFDLLAMQKVMDVYDYFSTPVDGSYHYDALVQARNQNQLPPNLQVLPETPRFNPETDTFFDGITAFPGRKRTVFTKEGEKFEKIIEWPHI